MKDYVIVENAAYAMPTRWAMTVMIAKIHSVIDATAAAVVSAKNNRNDPATIRS